MSEMKAKRNVDCCGGSRFTREITSTSQEPLAFHPLSVTTAARSPSSSHGPPVVPGWPGPVSPAAVAPTHCHLPLVHSSSLQAAPKFTHLPRPCSGRPRGGWRGLWPAAVSHSSAGTRLNKVVCLCLSGAVPWGGAWAVGAVSSSELVTSSGSTHFQGPVLSWLSEWACHLEMQSWPRESGSRKQLPFCKGRDPTL